MLQEAQQLRGLLVGRGRLADAAQERLSVVFQQGDIVEGGGIEHDVGVLLEGENVAHLATAHGGPAEDVVLRRNAAGAVVPHDTAQQALVRGGAVVLLAARQGGEGGNIDIEDAVARDVRRQGGVKGVDAFHEEHVAVLQAETVAIEDAVSLLEVELRDLHLTACEQVGELLVEESHVHGAERFVVTLAVLVDGRIVAVDEVVVQFDYLGLEPQHAGLLGDAQRRTGLAAGGGARHHHDLATATPPEDLVGRLGVLALLTGFAEVDQFDGLSGFEGLIDFLQGVDAYGLAPLFVLRTRGFNLGHKSSFKKGPVTDAGLAAICSGVPIATILPPAAPPSGPMSIR